MSEPHDIEVNLLRDELCLAYEVLESLTPEMWEAIPVAKLLAQMRAMEDSGRRADFLTVHDRYKSALERIAALALKRDADGHWAATRRDMEDIAHRALALHKRETS